VNYSIYIWGGALVVTFGILWYTGQLVRAKKYWDETWVEMGKCNWPTWNELKGSTLVVMISIIILGGFTVVVDLLFTFLVHTIT
jgi:preprotein translocase subunit SecE